MHYWLPVFRKLPIWVEKRMIPVAANALKESIPHSTFRQRRVYKVKEISNLVSVHWRGH